MTDMTHHDGGFSHSSGLQCNQCPGYPHAGCVSRVDVEAIVTRAVNAALNEAADEIEGWRDMSHRRADDRSKDDHDRSKAIQRGNAYDRATRIVRARTTT